MGVSVHAKPLREGSHLPKPLGPLLPTWLLWSSHFFLIKWWKSQEMDSVCDCKLGCRCPLALPDSCLSGLLYCGPYAVWKFPFHLSQVCFYIKLALFVYKCMQGRL